VPIDCGVTSRVSEQAGSCNSGTSRTISCVAAGHLCSKRPDLEDRRAAAAFRGKCCEHPEQDEHGSGWRAADSDERGLVTRAGSQRGAGGHFPAAPPVAALQRHSQSSRRASPVAYLKPSPAPDALLVLAGRATRVPQAAVTSGIPRTITVTSGRPMGWTRASDLGWGRSPKLHGMQGVRGSNPLSSERHLPEICQKTRPVAARTLSALKGSGWPSRPAQRPPIPREPQVTSARFPGSAPFYAGRSRRAAARSGNTLATLAVR
jgi:hypothetical protein